MKPQESHSFSRYRKVMWLLAAGLVLSVILFFILLSFQDLPDFQELENPEFELATTILDNEGKEFGRYYTQNRVPVQYPELNPLLVDALVSTEDERYWRHSGIDFKSLGRVAYGIVTMNGNKGGGSTITQQLAKLLFERPDFTGNKLKRYSRLFITKFKEWITAVKLERSYTKEEIISMYLNKFNFIYGAYGIRAAAEIYFGKNQADLNIEECATLIGMLKNPALFNPIRRPEMVVERRMVVLSQMRRNGFINQVQYDSLKVLPLDMSNFKRQTHAEGIGTYFRAELAKWLKQLLEREEFRKADGSKYNIYRDGLKIQTTINSEMQQLAEEVMVDHMKDVQDRYWRVWRKRDPWKYEAEPEQRRIREKGLQSLIRFSDRYQAIRTTRMEDILKRIETETGARLSDWDIENLIAEKKRKGGIARLVARKTISSNRADGYRKVMDLHFFDEFLKTWDDFQDVVKEDFAEERVMKVFDYNAAGEKEVTMSPLDSVKYHRQFLQTGILAIDPRTGYIKTWVGGINHKYFQFDHVQTSRQVGSTFKPFIYATAIALQGISPCFPVVDQPYTIAPGDGRFGLLEPWTPANSDGEYSMETLTLYECLKESKNTCSVFLMQQLGNANVVRGLAHNMGIDSSKVRSDGEFRLPNQPSICLGSADLSVMEMTGAYTTFANNGLYSKPIFVTSIEDKNGRVIYRAVPEARLALPPKANYVMVDMLRNAGTNLWGITSEVGGKTGTTNDYVDGWFIGITPSLVVGTWVGGEDPWIRFLSLANGQGSVMAKPFYRSFMQKLEKMDTPDYTPGESFYRPSGNLDIEIDCEKYKLLFDQQELETFEDDEEYIEEFDEEEY